ncbi:MAG TPA: GNAT family N-acetyltransferase [Thermoanaerobaculia bacterium]
MRRADPLSLDRVARVLIAHNPVGAEDDPSALDVLAQVALVEKGLAGLGLASERIAVSGAGVLQAIRARAEPGAVVFHLMEAPPGASWLHAAHTTALELAEVPFTGSATFSIWLTTDKLSTRAVLAAEGLPVAPGGRLDPDCPKLLDQVPAPWILKPAWEEASIGLEGDPVCRTREAALARASELTRRFPGQPVLAERFLPGREFNISLLADGDGVQVLPVAEMLYQDFPEGMSRVLGYEAKWLEDSFACIHTVRSFPDNLEDGELLDRLRHLSRAAWRACGVSGYARIDLRLDEASEPRILEVNTNPCLAADAGFMAAAAQAGLSPSDVVGRILAAALRDHDRRGRPSATAQILRSAQDDKSVAIRHGLEPSDRDPVEELIRETGFFNPEEIEVAMELVDDRLANGEASHYRFLVGEVDGQVAGYACWGPIPGTRASADLYWIVVHPRTQGRGMGAALLRAAEEQMAGAGRTRVYVETSTRAQYDGTRRFYHACGYTLAAELPDFYAPGDGKAVFLKVLS